ncbi:hypothetical protein B0A54_00841 [Friedmanniomyces endolithicus]|uniref:Protein LURP-one-related 15 n=1 Tax=Friedmanniomyces endolithicus TaxID=329885 RepID=A0A4U0VK12_9PEZI|nr:hypothetical protein B0A54_00841 [Friedmanniomyces endolithicus]
MAPTLLACNPALGPQPTTSQLYSPNQTTLVMKEKVFSITGEDFTVRTVDGHDVCHCKGKVVSAHDSKKFTDTNGADLFTLKNKMFALNRSFHGETGRAHHDFEVKGHWKMIGSRSTVTFKNASDGTDVELEVKGDWMDKSADITFAGREVAKISRSFFNVRQLMERCSSDRLHTLDRRGEAQSLQAVQLTDPEQYQVTVAPNVDLSLIAAICVSLDEQQEEAKK